MARVQCEECGGTYDTVSADGVTYFHVCPPMHRIRVRFEDGREELLEARVAEHVAIAAGGVRHITRTFDPALPPGAEFVAEELVRRPGHRDENLEPDPDRPGKLRRRHDGRGTRPAA